MLLRAQGAEPSVTDALQTLTAEVDGELIKLEYRLKRRESALRKVRKLLHTDPSRELASVELTDTLRYTMRVEDSPAGHHVSTIHRVLRHFEAAEVVGMSASMALPDAADTCPVGWAQSPTVPGITQPKPPSPSTPR